MIVPGYTTANWLIPIASRSILALKSTVLSVWLKGVAMPSKLQVMEGVGTPVEVQEMSTESPSRTVTIGPLMAVVLALTNMVCMQNYASDLVNRYTVSHYISKHKHTSE